MHLWPYFHKKSHRHPPKCYTFPTATTQLSLPHKEVVTDRDSDLSLSYAQQAQSQPVGKSTIEGNNTVATGVTDDNKTPSHIAQAESQPVGQPQSTSCKPVAKLSASQQKWERYKTSINKARRQKYGSNPSPIRQRVRQAYSLDPSPIKARKREKYHLDPSPVKAHMREKYHLDPSPIKASKREKYHLDPSPIKTSKREKYHLDPSPIKASKREKYHLDPSPIKASKREKYHLDPSPIKAHKRDVYKLDPSPAKARNRKNYRCNPSPVRERARATYRLNPSLKRMRSTVAYRNDHLGIKLKRRLTYKFYRQNLIDKRSLDKLLACAISKKYKKLPDNFKKYSSNMLRNITRSKFTPNDLETEHLVKSCMYFRNANHKRFISAFRKLKLSALATLSKLHESSEDPVEILLGPSLHTASSESFFPSSTYHDAALDTDGNVIVSKFPIVDVGNMQKHWTCVPDLCKLDSSIVTSEAVCTIYRSIGECDPIRARYYIQHIDDCDHPESHDLSLAGHSKSCHLDPNACNSKLLYLQRLAHHFPNIRTLVSMIYNVR